MIAKFTEALHILSLPAGRHNPYLRGLWKTCRESKPVERPLRMLRDERVASGGQLREPGAGFFVARLSRAQPRIADRDAGIAHKPSPLRALYGAAAKDFAKFFFGERDQPFQTG